MAWQFFIDYLKKPWKPLDGILGVAELERMMNTSWRNCMVCNVLTHETDGGLCHTGDGDDPTWMWICHACAKNKVIS